MVNSTTPTVSRKWNVIALVYSSVMIIGGLILSLVIDDWIALICATGLAILPLGVFVSRKKR
jgi:hypothetical protein